MTFTRRLMRMTPDSLFADVSFLDSRLLPLIHTNFYSFLSPVSVPPIIPLSRQTQQIAQLKDRRQTERADTGEFNGWI